VITSKICPSGYFRIFSWWKEAVGTLPRWKQDPLAVPARVVARLTIDRIPLAAALEKRLVHGDGIVATNCPSAPCR
jgi:hypothetical protein